MLKQHSFVDFFYFISLTPFYSFTVK